MASEKSLGDKPASEKTSIEKSLGEKAAGNRICAAAILWDGLSPQNTVIMLGSPTCAPICVRPK